MTRIEFQGVRFAVALSRRPLRSNGALCRSMAGLGSRAIIISCHVPKGQRLELLARVMLYLWRSAPELEPVRLRRVPIVPA